MINAAYYDKPLILSGQRFGRSSSPIIRQEYKLLNIFEFIKAVSDTVLDMRNAAYYDKPLILSGQRFGRSSSPIVKQ